MGRDNEKQINGSEGEVGAELHGRWSLSHSFNTLGTRQTRNESITPKTLFWGFFAIKTKSRGLFEKRHSCGGCSRISKANLGN